MKTFRHLRTSERDKLLHEVNQANYISPWIKISKFPELGRIAVKEFSSGKSEIWLFGNDGTLLKAGVIRGLYEIFRPLIHVRDFDEKLFQSENGSNFVIKDFDELLELPLEFDILKKVTRP